MFYKMINQYLKAKEERYILQLKMLNYYQKGLLTINLNIPGIIKLKPLYFEFFNLFMKSIIIPFLQKEQICLGCNDFRILFDKAGFYVNIVLITAEIPKLIEIKKNFLILEKTNICFRLLDLDVINLKHENISRNLFYPPNPRLCFICSQAAKECALKKTHNLIELLSFIDGRQRGLNIK
ncbi:citrate lyase holo-[acyl-carrier protein] synthase [Candidatus Phytoplasma fabacearum]|nr:citrate lyase holo-[acyl-carrier protein] synthase ['Bituminaria bituminosa' little leaf phytoplasma]MDV3163413.1 citrate lyase holo-[acyl-carrier protein] synthase [Pigeon pea little leaf phytoplasma]MDO7983631.1 citrate lyase holo-[acyl-carrier protein] synthase ['Bituminaria bituminosa' little leaf phytoplasma]MDO8030476.1 citrate lyase holo-[acyl-carrier protein] synthase ['Bituminaria bituminosa' little leaf phytoplasma]MDV3164472.1 citrate lyase holo-[acyl-carrier protein] synthase [Pi